MIGSKVGVPSGGKRLKAGIAGAIALLLGTVAASVGLSGVAHGTSEAVGYPSGSPSIALTSTVGTAAQPQIADQNGNFTIAVRPANFTLSAANGSKANTSGVGQYQVYLDHFDPASASNSARGYVAQGSSGAISISPDQLAKAGAVPGVHELFVALANNDRSLVPGAGFAGTVIRIGPSLAIEERGTAVHPLALAANGSLTLHMRIRGLTLDAADAGGANKQGMGHYHLYLDSFNPTGGLLNYITKITTTTYTISAARLIKAGATPGIHTLFMVLSNNDHSIINPATGDSVTIRLGS